MYFKYPFDTSSSIVQGDYVIATYYAFGLMDSEILRSAGQFAIGQTVGTWIELPGVTEEMVEQWQARVLAVYALPDEAKIAVLRIAFPRKNFDSSFAMMLTAIIGNDVSTSLKVKLVDLEFTENALRAYRGPRQGATGFREATGVYDRPLILNMIKPCIGYSPERGAELFYQSGLGGVDLIKDDELLADTSVSGIAARIKAYGVAAKRLTEKEGKAPVYIANITDTPKRMHQHAKVAIEEGAKAVMINFVMTGIDALNELTEEYGQELCFLAHYAGYGVMNFAEGGISSRVALGILPRLAGADAVMTMFTGGRQTQGMLDMLSTIQKQRLPMGTIKPMMTTIGGGITPASIPDIMKLFGNDIIIGVGGAVQGHPMGTTAGAKAMMDAMFAVIKGETIDAAATYSPELKASLEIWDNRTSGEK